MTERKTPLWSRRQFVKSASKVTAGLPLAITFSQSSSLLRAETNGKNPPEVNIQAISSDRSNQDYASLVEASQPHQSPEVAELSAKLATQDLPERFHRIGLKVDLLSGDLGLRDDIYQTLFDSNLPTEQKHQKLLEQITQSINGNSNENTNGDEPTTRDLAIAAVGTIIAIGTIVDLTKRGRVGIRDLGALAAANVAGSALGSEHFRQKINHNLKETAVSMAKIEAITILSSKFIQVKADVPQPLEEDIISTEEMVEELEHEVEEIVPGVHLVMAEEEEKEIREYLETRHRDKKAALAEIMVAANVLGPVASTFASSAIIRPLYLEMATQEDGTEDKDMMGTLQGWIPNYMGLWGLPIAYPILGNIGGGIGPRAAIQALKDPKVLSQIDKQLLAPYLFSNVGFAAEMVARMTPEERGGNFIQGNVNYWREFASGVPRLKAITDIIKRGIQIETKDQITRGIEHLPHLKEAGESFVSAFKSTGPKKLLKNLSEADAKLYEGVREVVGHEVGEIAYVLFMQSLAIPHMETTLSWVLENAKKAVPKNVSPQVVEQALDFTTYALVAGMSSTFDNYVAVNIAQKVTEKRIEKHVRDGLDGEDSRGIVKDGQIDAIELKRRHMEYTLVGYVGGMFGGSFTPPGNMANIAQFSLHEYSMQDALQPKRLASRAIPTLTGYGLIKALPRLGLLNELDDPEFDQQVLASSNSQITQH